MPHSVEGIRTRGGVLVYEATISESGAVQALRPLRPLPRHPGYPDIDRAFRETVASWRYTPTLINGKAVAVCLTVSLTIDVR